MICLTLAACLKLLVLNVIKYAAVVLTPTTFLLIFYSEFAGSKDNASVEWKVAKGTL